MNRLEINPNNEKYYSKEFMQGYKCGTKSQFDADMKVLEQIRADIEKVFCMSVVTNELRTPMEVKTEILQIIDKYKGG